MTFGIMIEEVIDTLRYITPALEQQEFIRNSQIEAFNYMQWTSEKFLSAERISNPKNTLWEAGLFR